MNMDGMVNAIRHGYYEYVERGRAAPAAESGAPDLSHRWQAKRLLEEVERRMGAA